MPITQKDAKDLCTRDEFELVAASFSPAIRGLDEKQLRALRGRARRLRDKWRGQAERQRGEVRGKRAPRGARPAAGFSGAARKARLFAETVDRIEKRLQRLAEQRELDRERAAARKAEQQRVRALRRANRNAKPSGRPGKAVDQVPRRKGVTSRGKAIKGHQRAAGQRKQARRDSR